MVWLWAPLSREEHVYNIGATQTAYKIDADFKDSAIKPRDKSKLELAKAVHNIIMTYWFQRKLTRVDPLSIDIAYYNFYESMITNHQLFLYWVNRYIAICRWSVYPGLDQ